LPSIGIIWAVLVPIECTLPLATKQIAAKAAEMSEELLKFNLENLRLLWETKAVLAVPNPREPWGVSYHFVDEPTRQIMIMRRSQGIYLA
jgi:hypothetical protein